MHDFPLRRRARLACLIAIWGPLMACQPTAPAAGSSAPPTATAQAGDWSENDHSEQAHLFKLNPSPKRVFEVEFEIHDAPGPLANVRGHAQYHASNCNFVTSEWAGTRAIPQTGLVLPMVQSGPNRFVATVYRDGMLDEDYYGTGICQWALMSVSAGFSANGAREETNFVVRLDEKEIQNGTTTKQYYWKGGYPRADGAEGASFVGGRTPEAFAQTRRSNLFSISTKVREMP